MNTRRDNPVVLCELATFYWAAVICPSELAKFMKMLDAKGYYIYTCNEGWRTLSIPLQELCVGCCIKIDNSFLKKNEKKDEMR